MSRSTRAAAAFVITLLGALPVALAQSEVVAWGSIGAGVGNAPALPPGLDYLQLDAGSAFAVAVRSDGSAVAWGANNQGQLSVPALPPGLRYVEVTAGGYHGLARRDDGAVVAWGFNNYNQCNVPALPSGVTYIGLAAGTYHSVALRSNGTVVAWGENSSGQCNVPALPGGLHYVQVAAGEWHSLALRSDGSVAVWGSETDDPPTPPNGVAYVELAAGWEHSLALRSDGHVAPWGQSGGYGMNIVPALPGGVSYVEIAAGSEHNVARRSDGQVVAWGRNDSGQCNVPALPAGFVYVEVAASSNYTLARRAALASSPVVYCTAKTNSLGCVPSIGFSGALALSGPDDFVIEASQVLNFRSGLLFWGRAAAAVPFQGGTRCVAAPLVRTDLQDSGGTPWVDDCSGRFAFELTHAYLAANALGAGDELLAQYWSRDPYAAPYFTGLTDALHVWVGP